MAVIGRILHLGDLLEARANKALKPFELRYTDFDVLATLRRSGKPYELTPTQLRKAVLMTSGAMTACLDRLEAANYIARRPNPNDRRGTYVRLTPNGTKLVDKAAAKRFAEAKRALTVLTPEEAELVAPILAKLTVHVSGG